MLLVDHISQLNPKFSLVEGKSPNGNLLLVGKLQEAEVNNGNGRVYPKEVLIREIKRYTDGPVKTRTSCGELDHPDSQVINLSNTSHLITEVWWEGNEVWGKLELLNTPSGKIAQEIVRAGIPLGISSRGMGSLKQIGESLEVQEDFSLLCWDLVSTPSTPQAYMRLSEGLEQPLENPYIKINSLVTDILCLSGFCPINKY
jgi:hypothetical protein